MLKVIDAYISLIEFGKESDSEFDTLENFLDSNFTSLKYSQSILDNVVKTILKLKVSDKDERDNKQLMIAFSFDQIHILYQKFSIIKDKNSSGDAVSEFIKQAVKDFSISRDLALSMIKCNKSWIN